MSEDNSTRSKPKVFIGSSTRGLFIAEAIQKELSHDAEVVLWSQGVFRTTNVAIEDLMAALGTYDFGIFVFLPEDRLEIRDKIALSVRDNVLFELGLFLGRLGRQRNFFVAPEGQGRVELHLPSDLSGITPATYDPTAANLQAAVGSALYQVKQSIRSLHSTSKQGPLLYDGRKDFKQYHFSHRNGRFWDGTTPISDKSDGTTTFSTDGTIRIDRRDMEGRYEIELRRDGASRPSFTKSPIPPDRVLRISCDVKAEGGEHPLRFVLKDEKANKWAASELTKVASPTWTPLTVYLRVPSTVDLLLRIDDEKPSAVPSTLYLRNLVIAEEQ